jgi:hypothetical protein
MALIDAYASLSPLRCHIMPSMEQRLLDKLSRDDNGCWVFTGVLSSDGYGLLWDNRRRNNSKAHRIAYELWVGPIPDEHDVHHVCENRACCNPSPKHLETKPSPQHNGDHHRSEDPCPRGHEFNAENFTVIRGQRVCRRCAKSASDRHSVAHRDEINRRRRERRRAARGAHAR